MKATPKSKKRPRRSQQRMVPPPYARGPGVRLLATIKARAITQTALAKKMGRPIKTINEIIHHKTRITEQTAMELEACLGVPAHFWLTMQTDYRLMIARKTQTP